MNEDLKTYYRSLDNYVKLCMTTFGKIKLSVIPEGVSFAVYNYFKEQPKMPSYDDFFKSCVHQCETLKVDLKPRFDAFHALCKKHNIDSHKTATSYIPIIPDDAPVDAEAEFWKIEKAKLTPSGIASSVLNGYINNPYRNAVLALSDHVYPELLKLYCIVHTDTRCGIKDYDSLKNYLTELHSTFK